MFRGFFFVCIALKETVYRFVMWYVSNVFRKIIYELLQGFFIIKLS
jgi:hypothetical protein